jgi:methyltransferase (TIGR00027 family)
MPELRDVRVFEVDHPDSQREKRARVAALTQVARDIRFVPVDFAHDDLDRALQAAGHDPERPTTWLWEGVVMYLTRADIEMSLAIVQRRSPPESRLIVLYHSPALILLLVGFLVRRIGEPLRSAFTPHALARLLANYGFGVRQDQGVHELARPLSPELSHALRHMGHLRLALAERR